MHKADMHTRPPKAGEHISKRPLPYNSAVTVTVPYASAHNMFYSIFG
ncbi:hypothetical protein ccbrp13_37170 [Ktedonobacteria bacterium brp13]|nr:hypothetical protein ccbrp13_37170 [Ktedonobacteria bacterium brp13]